MRAVHGGQQPPPEPRPHDARGFSPAAHAVMRDHRLDPDRVAGWSEHYELKDGEDFNIAPGRDFYGAPLGRNLADLAKKSAAFAPVHPSFKVALGALNYAESDSMIGEGLKDGLITDARGASIYPLWRQYAERLEGYNVALYKASRHRGKLDRFIKSFGELGNYQHGRWRRVGDLQDRVSATVGESNEFIDDPAALVSYDMRALAGWTQAVRYSPYPRSLDQEIERFGDEKDGAYASEGEVHIHAGCPIPPREHIKIRVLAPAAHRRFDVVERYGRAGVVERGRGAA